MHKLIENNQILLKKEQENKINILELEDHFKEVDNKLTNLVKFYNLVRNGSIVNLKNQGRYENQYYF